MGSIAFLVPGSLGTLTGGYRYDRRMVDGLRARGWRVDVREIDGDFPRPAPRSLERAGRELAAQADRAIVVVDGLALGAMPAEAERERSRLRLVALVHHPLALETGLDRERAAALEASERRALATARLVVVTSRGTAEGLSRYGVPPSRIAVVEPGTDRAPAARGSGVGRVGLLAVGAVVPRKGHERLVAALAAIPERHWHLTCVGSLERDPSTVARVRTLIEAARLGDRVTLAGERDGAGLAAAYDAADVFVLPTAHEGYGMAVAEAIAHGLPVVATPTGGIADLVAGGDRPAGLLVAPGEPDELRAALSLVIRDGAARARFAEGARRVRHRLPTWDDAASRMAEALSRV